MNSSQLNNKQEEHNCIMTLIKPIEPPCAKRNKRADHGLDEEDQLQNGLNMNMKARQSLEGTKDRHPAAYKQNRRLFHSLQTIKPTEHQVDCQPTLQASKRLAWCMFERGISKNGIFRHERRSQDSKITRRVLTKPTRTVVRSRTRQFLDKG